MMLRGMRQGRAVGVGEWCSVLGHTSGRTRGGERYSAPMLRG